MRNQIRNILDLLRQLGGYGWAAEEATWRVILFLLLWAIGCNVLALIAVGTN